MACIPAEARGRFLEELPSILDSITDMEAAMPALAAEAHAKLPTIVKWFVSLRSLEALMLRQLATQILWVDDDKRTGTISMQLRKGSPVLWTRAAPLDATGSTPND